MVFVVRTPCGAWIETLFGYPCKRTRAVRGLKLGLLYPVRRTVRVRGLNLKQTLWSHRAGA